MNALSTSSDWKKREYSFTYWTLRTDISEETLVSNLTAHQKRGIIFDIDGVLIEAGLEVWAKKNQTLEAYLDKYKSVIQALRIKLMSLRNLGWEIYLCTGRGEDFAKRVGDAIIGKDNYHTISEWGVIIKKNGIQKITPWLKKSSCFIHEKTPILRWLAESLSGTFEEGKQYVLSFNPPLWWDIYIFRENLIKLIKKEFPDYETYLTITNSQTAVDIIPKGTDKIIALEDATSGYFRIYFWDAMNDLVAMKWSHIGIIPENADATFSLLAQEEVKSLFLANGIELKGVNNGIDFISRFFGINSIPADRTGTILDI